MGNQQLKGQNSNLLFPPKQKQIDVVSEILESQSSNIIEPTKQAIRISEDERDQMSFMSEDKEDKKVLNSKCKMENIGVSNEGLEELCRLARSSEKQIGDHQKYVIEGTLLKWEPSKLFSQPSYRYAAATTQKFMYNQNNMRDSNRAGILNFDLLSCVIVPEHKHNKLENFRIKVNGSDKQFVFSAANSDENKKWVDMLTSIVEKSPGRQYNLTYLSHYHRFWRKDYFSQLQFRMKAETGDVILMRGVGQSAMVQRAITQQQYDHVALVIKNIKNQILLFEANGATGVGVLPWKRFIEKQYYKQQEIVVYRKLKIDRSQQFFEQVEQFVQRNMGRKYKFSVKKYIMNRQSTDGQDKKSYFCSSLVAKLYKNLQLLDDKVSSITYMPHSFTEKQNMQLKQTGKYGPAKLGKQHIIVFQKMFFNQSC